MTAASEQEIHGFIGEGTRLQGEFRLQGVFRIDGYLSGRITGGSSLIVGPRGELNVTLLRADRLTVSGVVFGDLEVGERLVIEAGGHVVGNITLGRAGLVVEPGGSLEATLKIVSSEDHDPGAVS